MLHTGENAPVFASVDAPAEDALEWLRVQLAAQRERDDPHALTPRQLGEHTSLLRIAWWDQALESSDDSTITSAESVLPVAVRAATHIEHGGTALALYLRNIVNEAWALAWDHELIGIVVRSACSAAAELAADDEAADEAAACAWELLAFLLSEFAVETAVLTGRLDPVVRIAAAATDTVAPLVDRIRALPHSPARTALLREAGNEFVYYQSVRDTAHASLKLLSREWSDAQASIDAIRERIAAADFNPMDASELRGHLSAADAIQAARTREWLHVDQGKVRIVYPFGIRATGRRAAGDVIRAVREGADALRAADTSIGGLTITRVLDRLDLSDAWQGADSLGRRYRGITVQLDDLVLEDSAGTLLEVIHPRIQLSELGNHIVVFEMDVEDAPAYRVAETINLATPVFGDLLEVSHELRLRPSLGTQGFSRIADLVLEILEGVGGILDRSELSLDHTAVAARDGSFGLMVTVERASSVIGDVITPLESARRLTELWGVQALVHPLPSGAASVADWSMYDIDAARTYSLLHLNDELLASNANVTLLASFKSPSYAIRDMESYIEFAHSLHGMYQGWQDTVRERAEQIADILHDVEEVLIATDSQDVEGEESADRLGQLVHRIEREELALQSFVQSNEATMLFIESPAIVTSPALRADLDTVLLSNRYAALRDNFDRAVREVLGSRLQPLLDVVHRRIEAAVEEERQERAERTERLFNVLGVALAIVGLSGLGSILQTGYGWEGPNTWWLIIAILAVSVVAGIGLYVGAAALLRTRTRRRPRGRPGTGPR